MILQATDGLENNNIPARLRQYPLKLDDCFSDMVRWGWRAFSRIRPPIFLMSLPNGPKTPAMWQVYLTGSQANIIHARLSQSLWGCFRVAMV